VTLVSREPGAMVGSGGVVGLGFGVVVELFDEGVLVAGGGEAVVGCGVVVGLAVVELSDAEVVEAGG
jgi:hypothetical protein